MRGFGGERVIRSLISYPRAMGIKALLVTLPYKIKENAEVELWRKYIARCVRITSEGTAKLSGGSYIKLDYDDIISPHENSQESEKTSGEIIAGVKDKLARMRDKEVIS